MSVLSLIVLRLIQDLWAKTVKLYSTYCPQEYYICSFDIRPWYSGWSEYLYEILSHLEIYTIAASLMLIVYYYAGMISYVTCMIMSSNLKRKRVLIVTGYPGDECLYFGSTITKLNETCEIFLLCYISGNDCVMNMAAKKEQLFESCNILGIPTQNIRMKFENGGNMMNINRLANSLLDEIETLMVEEVYTFDKEGVNKKQQNVLLFHGFASLCLSNTIPPYCKVYMLESINLFRKYSSFMDITPSFLLYKKCFVASPFQYSDVVCALNVYKNELGRYRYVHGLFSRYMLVNTYVEMLDYDIDLLLQLPD